MNGVHDLGGMENLGPVEVEPNEPVFHHEWERRTYGLLNTLIGTGYFQVDDARRIIEWMPPADYLSASYYEKWLFATEGLLIEKGVLTRAEIEAGRSLGEGHKLPALPAAAVRQFLAGPLRMDVPSDAKPRFKIGDAIIARNMHPHHHTRIPRYVRGRRGTIIQVHETYKLPDTNAHGDPTRVEHVYMVEFSARELWGAEAPPNDTVALNLFDSYMDLAPRAA
jgi:nitrile hydratase